MRDNLYYIDVGGCTPVGDAVRVDNDALNKLPDGGVLIFADNTEDAWLLFREYISGKHGIVCRKTAEGQTLFCVSVSGDDETIFDELSEADTKEWGTYHADSFGRAW